MSSIGELGDIPRKATDLTKNGKCTGCGACCSNILPLSDKEVERIKRYIKRHNIKPCRHGILSAKPLFDMVCPFLDESKKDKKCKIYPVRPEICRQFICCNSPLDLDIERFYRLGRYKPVSMRGGFYD